ncbi:MAG: GHKL domain-containing protein [Bacteroidetes bacterium]|nr:GHKL domain-containing protein [Bacteroidota bacterium]MBS1757710.1 GHKL domain-containing protein [Bacteroidota bacterium]
MPHKQKKIQTIFIIYWVLLAYIIAALVWWFIALSSQNAEMTQLKLNEIKKDNPTYWQQYQTIQEDKKRKTTQYIGEGSIFLLLIIAGAIFVFRAVRRQLKFSHDQYNFMMAITHELKTPIAVSRLNLETLLKRKLDESQHQRLIYNTLQETNRLNTLCNNILLSSQIEAGGFAIASEQINWSNLINNCVNDFIARYPQRAIQQQVQPDVFVLGDQFLLQIAINNLIENALKYSPKEGIIKIDLFKKNNTALLEIKDNGPGIADDEKKKVFEKFYRTGNEATKRAKGTGLGLYLLKKIIKSHKGNITLTDNMDGGCIFTITLQSEA